jgi:hypothetical protein
LTATAFPRCVASVTPIVTRSPMISRFAQVRVFVDS